MLGLWPSEGDQYTAGAALPPQRAAPIFSAAPERRSLPDSLQILWQDLDFTLLIDGSKFPALVRTIKRQPCGVITDNAATPSNSTRILVRTDGDYDSRWTR